MRRRPVQRLPLVLLAAILLAAAAQCEPRNTPGRNVIVFVADGMRHGSVNAQDTPALWRVRTEGVHFQDSYSLFPTFTSPNASAIATGHLLGDTGDFSNTVWVGHATFDTGNFNLSPGTPVPFLENDQILADVNAHYDGNYLGEESLLSAARSHGYHTAAIGKLGPTAIQDVTTIRAGNGSFQSDSEGLVVDDATGAPGGVPLPPPLRAEIEKAMLPLDAPTRNNGYGATSRYNNGYSGDFVAPGTLMPNAVQQQWFVDVTTRAILPWFEREAKPFAIVFWSRDPDGTQHNQGDSLNRLSPGINGDTSRAAIRNADRALQQLLAWLDAHPAISATPTSSSPRITGSPRSAVARSIATGDRRKARQRSTNIVMHRAVSKPRKAHSRPGFSRLIWLRILVWACSILIGVDPLAATHRMCVFSSGLRFGNILPMGTACLAK